MLGAVIGDIVGSPYEFTFNNIKTTDFPLISENSHTTDDSIMTLAVAEALMKVFPVRGAVTAETENAENLENLELKFEEALVEKMQFFGRQYINAGYGIRFIDWVLSDNPKPYNSYGNGSAMRVSPVAWAFDNLETVEKFATMSARISHNHPEGIKGAQATAAAIYLARTGKTQDDIKDYIVKKYGYDLSRTLDDIRPNYYHIESCQQTVPEAITAFLEADNFEDALRKAVSLGGDSDTLTAITASIAEGMWGIPAEIEEQILPLLDIFLRDVISRWDEWRK